MPARLSDRFNILAQSPHDRRPAAMAVLRQGPESGVWVASRYNVRATTEDGRLVLWNTFRGSMSVFKVEEAEEILALLTRQGIAAPREGLVEYLADRGFLVHQDANEYRELEVAIGQQHFRTDRLELILMASEDCNFRCKYCYEEFARGTMLPEVRGAIKQYVRKRLSQLGSLQVRWFGGEPLYGWAAIEELAPFFQETARDNELVFQSQMTTNGYLLTPEVARRLLGWGVRQYQITVDGLAEDHDRNRPTRDGQGTFDTILDNLRALARCDELFLVNVRINFDRENGPRLDRFLEVLERGFRDDPRFLVSFHAVGRWGGPNDADLEVCGAEESGQLQERLRHEARRRGLALGSLREVNRLGSQVCYAARPYNFLIGATGKVMKCTIALDRLDYNVVGHLTPDGEMVLDSDKMALWTEPAFENDSKCQKCVVLPLCQGTHCPLIRMVENRSPCCGVRSGAKKELRELVELGARGARRKVETDTDGERVTA